MGLGNTDGRYGITGKEKKDGKVRGINIFFSYTKVLTNEVVEGDEDNGAIGGDKIGNST